MIILRGMGFLHVMITIIMGAYKLSDTVLNDFTNINSCNTQNNSTQHSYPGFMEEKTESQGPKANSGETPVGPELGGG